MKRSRLKKNGKSKISKLQKELWAICRKVAEARWPSVCFTCGKQVEGSNRHLGHFIPRPASAYLKFDIRNLRWQCYHCNINLGGYQAEFYRRLVETEGQEYVDQLFEDKKKICQAWDRFTELKALYEAELE
jgi:DNA-directed RNA polymerase subunit N (RpoN/RPB10)